MRQVAQQRRHRAQAHGQLLALHAWRRRLGRRQHLGRVDAPRRIRRRAPPGPAACAAVWRASTRSVELAASAPPTLPSAASAAARASAAANLWSRISTVATSATDSGREPQHAGSASARSAAARRASTTPAGTPTPRAALPASSAARSAPAATIASASSMITTRRRPSNGRKPGAVDHVADRLDLDRAACRPARSRSRRGARRARCGGTPRTRRTRRARALLSGGRGNSTPRPGDGHTALAHAGRTGQEQRRRQRVARTAARQQADQPRVPDDVPKGHHRRIHPSRAFVWPGGRTTANPR